MSQGITITDPTAIQAAEQHQARQARINDAPARLLAKWAADPDIVIRALTAYQQQLEDALAVDHARQREEDQLQKLALLLAGTDLNVWQALLNKERVPLSRLNQKTVRRYGLRNLPLCSRCPLPDRRVSVYDFNLIAEKR